MLTFRCQVTSGTIEGDSNFDAETDANPLSMKNDIELVIQRKLS